MTPSAVTTGVRHPLQRSSVVPGSRPSASTVYISTSPLTIQETNQ